MVTGLRDGATAPAAAAESSSDGFSTIIKEDLPNPNNPLPPFPTPQPGDQWQGRANEQAIAQYLYTVGPVPSAPPTSVLRAGQHFSYAVSKTLFNDSGLRCTPVVEGVYLFWLRLPYEETDTLLTAAYARNGSRIERHGYRAVRLQHWDYRPEQPATAPDEPITF